MVRTKHLFIIVGALFVSVFLGVVYVAVNHKPVNSAHALEVVQFGEVITAMHADIQVDDTRNKSRATLLSTLKQSNFHTEATTPMIDEAPTTTEEILPDMSATGTSFGD